MFEFYQVLNLECEFIPYKYEFGVGTALNLNVNARPTFSIIDPDISAPALGYIPGKFLSYGNNVARVTKPYDVHRRRLPYTQLGI